MPLRASLSAFVALTLAALASACATVPKEPQIAPVQTVEVKVPTPVACPALAQLGPEPLYPDTDAAILAAPSAGARAKLYVTGRKMRIQRLAEFVAAKLACQF